MTFTANLQRHLEAPPAEVSGGTVGEALAQVFAKNPRVRGYLLDDQGAVRRHVVIFVGGRALAGREKLSDAVAPDAEISVLQALSGG